MIIDDPVNRSQQSTSCFEWTAETSFCGMTGQLRHLLKHVCTGQEAFDSPRNANLSHERAGHCDAHDIVSWSQ